MTRSLSISWRWRSVTCSAKYEFPGDDIPIVQGSALKALEGDAAQKANILKLMQAVDDFIPLPERPIDQDFLMPVEDVFSIEGRGTVATGRIERGIVKKMEEVEIVGIRDTVKTTITDIEMFRKLLDEGRAGDNVGLLLRGTKKEEIERGQVIAKPGSIKPHKKFKGEVYVLSKDEGGRHTPFFSNYRPQFYFRTTDVTGSIVLPEGVEMVMPGDNVAMEVELITPIALEKTIRFAIREGGSHGWCRASQRDPRLGSSFQPVLSIRGPQGGDGAGHYRPLLAKEQS